MMGTESAKEITEQEIRRHVKLLGLSRRFLGTLLITVGARQTNFYCISSYDEGSGFTQTEET
jgi:hypothetical protein